MKQNQRNETTSEVLDKLVAEFAKHVAAQKDAMWSGSARDANRHAKRVNSTFDKLCAYGDAGRDALTALFTHPRVDVRVMAAAFLLRHKTAEAKGVLEAAAKGSDFTSFSAQQALKRWEEGTWELDPEPQK